MKDGLKEVMQHGSISIKVKGDTQPLLFENNLSQNQSCTWRLFPIHQ